MCEVCLWGPLRPAGPAATVSAGLHGQPALLLQACCLTVWVHQPLSPALILAVLWVSSLLPLNLDFCFPMGMWHYLIRMSISTNTRFCLHLGFQLIPDVAMWMGLLSDIPRWPSSPQERSKSCVEVSVSVPSPELLG